MFDFLEVAQDYAAGCSYTLQTHATKEGRVSKLHNSHMHKSTNKYHKLKSVTEYQKVPNRTWFVYEFSRHFLCFSETFYQHF